MRRTEFLLTPILMLASVAWFTISTASTPMTADDTPAPAAGAAADTSTAEKAAAARKERCRLHPGTCKRGPPQPEPPKPSQPG